MADAERCVLCGLAPPTADAGGIPRCPVCGWRLGDSPDPDLPRPRVEVVYYVRWDDRIKIGTTREPRRRLAAIWHHELLAFERGGRAMERARHAQFAHLREGGEWFRAEAELRAHAARLTGEVPPWHRYARWVADALRGALS